MKTLFLAAALALTGLSFAQDPDERPRPPREDGRRPMMQPGGGTAVMVEKNGFLYIVKGNTLFMVSTDKELKLVSKLVLEDQPPPKPPEDK